MTLAVTFYYSDLFNGLRPKPSDLLKEIPSRYVIGVMAMVNDILSIKKRSPETQSFILYSLTVNIAKEERTRIFLKAMPKINEGRELFAFPFTVKFINDQVINFRKDENVEITDNGLFELSVLKAYLATLDEILEQEIEMLKEPIEEVKKGGDPMKLLWPHVIRQFEFTNKPDLVYECFKGMAFCAYLEKHPKLGAYVTAYFQSFGCQSGQEYLGKLLRLIDMHFQREDSNNPRDYIYRINTKEYEAVLDSLVINPNEVNKDPLKQQDNLGLKKAPLFQDDLKKYIVPYWYYLYTALFTGLVFSIFRKSGIHILYEKVNANNEIIDGFGTFKGIIGKEFAENTLFKNTMLKCFSKKHDTLSFFNDNDKFNPDCYYRSGRNIFIIEFKDYLLSSEVIQSGSYEKIRSAIEAKFVTSEEKGKLKDKGINQLARNIEWLIENETNFYIIDRKAAREKLKLKNMIIHPIIIQTSIYFDIPGINIHLNDLLKTRLNTSKSFFRKISPFTMIYFEYFFERLLLFSDSKLKLSDELNNYHQTIEKAIRKALRTRDVDDWFASTSPFSFVQSPNYQSQRDYKRNEFAKIAKDCWKI